MTTVTPPFVTAAGPRARFRHLVAAEWIKLWSLRSTYWVLAAGALIVVGINANSARVNLDWLTHQDRVAAGEGPGAGTGPVYDAMSSAFVDPAWQLLMVVAGSVGALAVFGEYTSGLIRTTFTAVPDRGAVMAAKAAVVSAVTLVLGAVVSVASFGVTQAILREHGGLSIGDPGALRAVAASALLVPLSALVGMAVGALVRHATGSIVTTLVTLILAPAFLQGDTYRWVKELGNTMPVTAWSTLTENPAMDFAPVKYASSVTEAWIVFAVWPLVAVAVLVTAVRRRDL
ncbi:ABC transporter permease [Streptomyces longisporoflavus]|uniref:ABC transporter permease n=1 Tax=Streptomyces longisporoflavus TaxID=28044 RepID=UPI00167D3550|nr:ABC transporter permease [Streptomyces longisporoflavus]GGV48188.1 ABC transporter permease [Streptomyces longisporoflavus]